VPGIRLRQHQWKHRPGLHSLRDQDDGGHQQQQQQQQQQLLQQLRRRVAPLLLHERLPTSQEASPGHRADPRAAAGDGGGAGGDGAPGHGPRLAPGEAGAPGLARPGRRQTGTQGQRLQ